LGLPIDARIPENKIETALINHLQQSLMELGKGFAFVANQQSELTVLNYGEVENRSFSFQ